MCNIAGMLAVIGFRHQYANILPDHFISGIAKNSFRCRVKKLHNALFVNHQNAIDHRFNNGVIDGFAFS